MRSSTVSRVQLALNVADLDESVAFYTRLFQTPPAKVRDGYANFAISDPPLKLILFAGGGEPGSLNHIGVEVDSPADVAAAIERATANGFDQKVEEQVSCCHAVQDKTWVQGPDNAWEYYTVLADVPETAPAAASTCCVGEDTSAASSAETPSGGSIST
jgi:catechol 2,3-dioxygenase-like lactoylglutathione lyase family enzyme